MQSDQPANGLAQTPQAEDLPAVPQIPLDLTQSTRIPLKQIGELGAAFAPLVQSLSQAAKATKGSTSEVLYRAADAAGNVLSPNQLHAFKDGSGYLGSIKGSTTSQARFTPVEVKKAAANAVDTNPEMLLVAAMLVQVNQKPTA